MRWNEQTLRLIWIFVIPVVWEEKNISLTCELQEGRVCLHGGIFHSVDQVFIGGSEERRWVFTSNESILASVTELSCMRLHEVTELLLLLLSESGNLYLALQVAHYGLCLRALQFRLQCVLLHGGGGLWISNRLSGEEQACCMVSDQLCLDLNSFQLHFFPPISGSILFPKYRLRPKINCKDKASPPTEDKPTGLSLTPSPKAAVWDQAVSWIYWP